jgi:serine/threonine-protein kinase
MGEVYRADDLTLDQPVALKFLPGGVAADDSRLAQFHNELRTARQVSHKNVVRLYDLGDADGRRFLTMEYVDGEDLASLLRRIGRIPQDKAVDLARQLCAGVAAAHARGVLHRDLKPANVMIDGDGDVRITDFGIATVGADTGAAGTAGTPQYMAPELLAGKPASIKSDIYALGLILFEVFTGRRAYDAKTLDALKQLHDTGTVTTPSSIVRDLDPAIERLILRCLDKDPEKRPGSALAVAAALPGGDPLAAALAAGETPSPDLLAAAGETEALPVGVGVSLVAAVVTGLLIFAAFAGRTSIIGRTPLDKAPAVLVDRVEQIITSLGYTEPPGDQAYSLTIPADYLTWIRENDRSARRWEALSAGSPSAAMLWYRSSMREMVPLVPMTVKPNDPPMNDSGMRMAIVDMRGRLQEFHAVPAQFDPDPTPPPAPRWEALFTAAGLSMADFRTVVPQWNPRDFADTRAAWEGTLPDGAHHPVRVEAAAYRGRPVSFAMIGPWSRASRQIPRQALPLDAALQATFTVAVVVLFVGAALLARYNLRVNRADKRGALRVASVIVFAYTLAWLVEAHHVPSIQLEFTSLLKAADIVVANGAILWVVYIALEPYVRRFWPDCLLGWTRLLSGHVRDPRVGRDTLAGVAFGVALSFTTLTQALVPPMLGLRALLPTYGKEIRPLLGPGWLVGEWAGWVGEAEISAMMIVLVFVVLRLLLRRAWLTIPVGVLLIGIVQTQGLDALLVALVFPMAGGALVTFVALRFGLLTLGVMFLVANAMTGVPLTLAAGHWWAFASNWTIAGIIALALFGFYASRAGQPLFGDFELKT